MAALQIIGYSARYVSVKRHGAKAEQVGYDISTGEVLMSTSTATTSTQSFPQKLLVFCKMLRPRQWTKNLIVFAAPLFAVKIHELNVLLAVTGCFIGMCCVSSAVYVLNDVIDVESDRKHPTKCKRPIASGLVSPGAAIAVGSIVAAIGLAIGTAIRPTLGLVFLTYLALQFMYATKLKQHPIIDVGCISTGFVLRAVAGAAAAFVPVSGWFLLCTGLGSIFLGLEKRRQELVQLGSNATECRRALGGYSLELLNRLESLVLSTTLTSYILYTFLSIHGQWMMLSAPFVLYGMARYLMLSSKGTTASPEEVLLKDKPIQGTIALWLIVCALVAYHIIPDGVVGFFNGVDAIRVLP